MNNLLLDCIYVFIISTILIHAGHLIYDMYEKYKNGELTFPSMKLFSNKSSITNKSNNEKEKMTHSMDSNSKDDSVKLEHDQTKKLESKNEEDGENNTIVEKEDEKNNSEIKDMKEPEKPVKNNSLNSLEELNDIKSNLKQMFNDLNKST